MVFSAIGPNVPKSENGKKLSIWGVFWEAWEEGALSRNIGEITLEGDVGDFRKIDNRELEEVKQPTNDIGESQLEGAQYKLAQRNARYSISRTKKLIEKEMTGMRKANPKGETNNCYLGAAMQVEINALGGVRTYERLLFARSSRCYRDWRI